MKWRLGDRCARELAAVADSDERIWALDGDLADSDGAIHFARRHPDRFLMAGIAEQAMVSMAAGMASCGRRPWVFSFAAFLCYRAYDQIRVGLSQTKQPVTLVGSHSGGCAARNGRTHAALNDLTLMTSLPNVTAWAPADAADVRLAVHCIVADAAPAYLRLPRRPVDELPGPAGLVRVLSAPAPLTLLGTGLGTHLAVAAAAELNRRGHPAGVLHCARVAPLPATELTEHLRGVDHLVTVEDHYSSGGLATAVAAANLAPRLSAFGWPPGWAGQSGDDADLLAAQRLDADGLAAQILAAASSDAHSPPPCGRSDVAPAGKQKE